MSGTACQVDRARVVAGSADDAPRWRFVVEDALRTAEFGDAGRLLVVRRLRLTGLPTRPAPGQLARALERAWAAQARQALPASSPGAAAAPAVWFVSRAEARAQWLAAWADDDHPRLAAWFWPDALDLAPPAPASAPTPALAAAVWRAAQADAPLAWWRRVAAWPERRVVVLARRWAAAPPGLPAIGGRPDAPPSIRPAVSAAPAAAVGDDEATTPSEQAAVAAVRARLQALPDVGGLPAPARRWLAALWLAGAATVPPSRLDAGLRRLEAAPAPGRPPPPMPPVPAAPAQGTARRPSEAAPPRAPAAVPAMPVAAAPPVVASGLPPPDLSAPAPVVPGPAPRAARSPALQRLAASRPWLADGEATTHGGLLFLLNLLPRLGFPAWLERQPDAATFADALFLHLLEATGAPPEDPQRACLAAPPPAPDPRLRAWRLRLRRALRRQAGLDLEALVRRDALLQATPTHLDLVFPLEDVDLRLRRQGLDLDPGWVPWFGRIVSFHFL